MRLVARRIDRQIPCLQRLMQRLDDVAALAYPAQHGLGIRCDPPTSRFNLFGEIEPLELLQTGGAQALLQGRPGVARRIDNAVTSGQSLQAAVETGPPLKFDLAPEPGFDLVIAPRAKVKRDNLGRPLAHPLADVIAGDDQVLALVVLAPQHDVAVRVAGIEMIDSHPIELGP